MSLTEAVVAVNSVRKIWVVSQLLATLHEMAGLKRLSQLGKLRGPKMHVVYVLKKNMINKTESVYIR